MAKTFRAWEVDQIWMLPATVQELVPENHPVHFVRETVREDLDLSVIFADYRGERGYPPYHPAMMTALLLYAYSRGVTSSRQMATGCRERVDFMAVTGRQTPDHRTISDFRKRHRKALRGLFRQVLALCAKAGLVKLGHVALDGTKVKANASRHKAMNYQRMKETDARLKTEIDRWFDEAERIDTEEDARYGPDRLRPRPASVAFTRSLSGSESLPHSLQRITSATGLSPLSRPAITASRPTFGLYYALRA